MSSAERVAEGTMTRSLEWYEVDGAGPDKFVRAASAEMAARAVAEHQAARPLDSLEWLDAGSDAGVLARFAWEAGDANGRVTVRSVSVEQAAALDALDPAVEEGEIIDAAEKRSRRQ